MTLIRWQMPPAAPVPDRPFAPSTDIAVGDHDVVLTMDLPGLTADDVTIEIVDGRLVVRGERPAPQPQAGSRYVRRERAFGAFERHLTLPTDVDPATITAAMEHGVLSLLVPKPRRPAPRRIVIGPPPHQPFSPGPIAAELLRPPKV
jgi:HSP20 family protein